MNVNFNSWHARLYRFHYKMKHDCDLRTDYPWEANTNLCPYMRTVLFYWWLRYLFASGRIWKIPVPAVVIPAILIETPLYLGVFSYDWKIGLLRFYGCVALFSGFIALLLGGSWAIEKAKNVRIGDEVTLAQRTSGFFSLVEAYWKSTHDKICPSIKLVASGK